MPTTTVEMFEDGRIFIPRKVRRLMGVDGQRVMVELTIKVAKGENEG